MQTADLTDQLAFLQAVQEGGLPVQAIELGYKPYLAPPESIAPPTFASGGAYAAEAERWVAAIRVAFPQAAIALAAALPNDDFGSEAVQEWNTAVFALAARQNLAVSLYPFPEPALEPGQPFTQADIAAVLALPFQSWQNYAQGQNAPLANLPAGVPIWLPEYNLGQEPPDQLQIAGTWAQTLFVLSQSLVFLSDKRVEYACPHQLLGPQQSAAYAINDQRFILLPTGRAVQLLGQVMPGMTAAQQMEFTNLPANALEFGYSTLLGWTFSDENGRQSAIVLNLGAEPREIEINNLPADFPSRYQQTIGPPTRRVRNNEGLEITNGDLADKNFLILPSYSVTAFPSEEAFPSGEAFSSGE
jgi:hypothetical protein